MRSSGLRRAAGVLLLAVLCGALVIGCRRGTGGPDAEVTSGPVLFEDVTEQSGIRFVHDADAVSDYRMPRIMGPGGAFLDFDNDGRLDVLLLHNGSPGSKSTNRLYRQKSDGSFEDVSAGSGLNFAGPCMGVAVGDFDNDGWVDLYVSAFGGGRLFRNRGKDPQGRWLGFEDVTDAAGVRQPRWGTSCAFFDYDRDGYLDLVVVNYVDYNPSVPCGPASGQRDFCHPRMFGGTAARLYRNRGRSKEGRWLGYEDVSTSSGLAAAPGPGLGVVCSDFDGDGWPDVFVANDAQPNHLWINQKDGTFKEQAVRRGIACNVLGQPQANMGVAWADANGDGLFDVFVTHLTEESNTLWLQGPRGQFLDATARANLAAPRWRGTGFGTVLADFDHDGWPDLVIVNGRVARGKLADAPDLPEFWRTYAERNQLFLNEGRGRFRDVSPANAPICGPPGIGRGLAWGDFDNDGAIDLLVTAGAGPARLFRNVAEKGGRWLGVRAIDPTLKREAHGARVTVTAGRRRWVAEVCPGQSYLSSGDPRVHLGLGAIDRVDELRIDWPDGRAETFSVAGLDRYLTLERGTGKEVGR
jgi:enediyne biosynthesis protein E4